MKKRWIFLSLIFASIGASTVSCQKSKDAGGARASAVDREIPVVSALAESREVPVWLTGIGSAQASNTVTVRPRVSGSLDQIHFTEGAMVKKGDVLAEIDPRPYRSILAQTQAQKAQNEAQLANAKLDAARITGLASQDAVSQQQLELAEANVLQLAALVQADEAAVQAAQLDLDFTTVRAPINGRTGIRLVDAGNIVTANQDAGLVVLTELQPITVIFTLPQRHLAAISKNLGTGSRALQVEALSESGDLLDRGELELIDNQIDSNTGTLRLKASFPNERLSLWPGQFVTARVLVETREDCVVVPAESVQPGIDGPFVYVIAEDQTVEPKTVTVGIEDGDGVVIEDGLIVGERVVVVGQSKLKPGSKVTVQEGQP